MTYHYEITRGSDPPIESLLSDLTEASRLCGLHPEMIEEFFRGRLVHGFHGSTGEIYFDQSGISRLRQIAYLREHEHTSLRTLRYIVSLLDNLESREKELRELRERIF